MKTFLGKQPINFHSESSSAIPTLVLESVDNLIWPFVLAVLDVKFQIPFDKY